MDFISSLHVLYIVIAFVADTTSKPKKAHNFVNKEIYEETKKRDDYFQGIVLKFFIILLISIRINPFVPLKNIYFRSKEF